MVACALLPACSLVLVREPKEAAWRNASVPPDCTTSNVAPLADFLIGAALAGLVAASTYAAVEEINADCTGNCYTPWKPALLGSFLVVSPWWISGAVGLSDTRSCRKLYSARGVAL